MAEDTEPKGVKVVGLWHQLWER